MANEALRNVISQMTQAGLAPSRPISVGEAAIDTQNILKAQEMARQLSPQEILLRRTKEAMQSALATDNKDLAKQMYEQYELPGETPAFDFLEDESAVAFGGQIYKGKKGLMKDFAGYLDQIDTPEEAEEAGKWFMEQGGSIMTDPHYKIAGKPTLRSQVKQIGDRQALIDMDTGEIIKDIGPAPKKEPGVSVQVGKGESAYEKKRGENIATWVDETYKNSRQAYNQMKTLDELEEIVRDPKVAQGGWIAKAKGAVDKIFGTKTGGKINLMEAFSIKMRGPDRLETVGPGPVSEAEQKLWSQIAPTIGNTREANLQLINVTRKLTQRKIEYSKELQRLEREGVPPLELQTRLQDWLDNQENIIESTFGKAVEGTAAQTATNPETGHKIIFKNNQWVDTETGQPI